MGFLDKLLPETGEKSLQLSPNAPRLGAPPSIPVSPYKSATFKRGKDGRFEVGNSPLAGPGRPAGLLGAIRAMTDDGLQIVEYAKTVLDGWLYWTDPETGETWREKATAKQRNWAAEFLADRGLLPRVHQLQVDKVTEERNELDLTTFSQDDMREWIRLTRKARRGAVIEGQATQSSALLPEEPKE